MYDPVTVVVNKILEGGGKARKQGKEFKCTCPAHDDAKASLQVGQGDKGAVLHCHAGCTNEAIVQALNMSMDDLFTEPLNQGHDLPARPNAKGAEATYYYEDEAGKVLFRVERHKDKRFVQSRPDPAEPGSWLYSLGDTRRVPFHLQNVVGAIDDNEPIFIVEGEKDVLNLEAQGLVATCNPGGAGKFKREFANHFGGARVVVLPDNDAPGRMHAEQVIDFLKGNARTITVLHLDVPEKGDVSDWLAMDTPFNPPLPDGEEGPGEPAPRNGQTLREWAAATAPLHTNRPNIINAHDLMQEVFPDMVMAVPGMIAEGVTFLVGAPKIGKSWMSLGLGLAVASGELALGSIPVEQGPVFYLALEDTHRRLQRRLNVMLGDGQAAPPDLHFASNWPRLNAGGLDLLEDWMVKHPDTRMCIIDTWAKVKSAMPDSSSMYDADYQAVSAVKELADRYETAVVLVHHQRKQTDGDALNTVAGSTGLTGAADATVILTRPRGAEEGHLYITGRDVEESRSIVSFDGETGCWTWLGEADEVEEQNSERAVIAFVNQSDEAVGIKDIMAGLDIKEGTAKWILAKLATENKIKRISRGKYVPNDGGGSGGSIVVQTVTPAMPGVGGPPIASGPLTVSDEDVDNILDELEGEFGADEEDE